MNLFTKQFMQLTGCSYEYAVAVWNGISEDMRKSPESAAQLKAREYNAIKRR
jgi:hypothetical protein